jgi:hypothetical protein
VYTHRNTPNSSVGDNYFQNSGDIQCVVGTPMPMPCGTATSATDQMHNAARSVLGGASRSPSPTAARRSCRMRSTARRGRGSGRRMAVSW